MKYSRLSSRLLASLFLSVIPLAVPLAHGGELKVDINNAARNQAVNTEPGYTMWSSVIPSGNPGTTVTGITPISQTFTTATGETVNVSFAQTQRSVDRGGTGIVANWYQVGVQNGTSRLVGDGIGIGPVADVAGGELEMKISGLSAGNHTLLTYHNAVDNPATNLFGPIDIFLNGNLVAANVQQTIRAATNADATTAYIEFSVSGPSEVVTILFSAQTDPAITPPTGVNLRRTPFINGFEIDTPNFNHIAGSPYPADFDQHADADDGITLTWSDAPSGNIVSHDVYFGTDKTALENAGHGSPEFKSNQATRAFPVSGLSNHQIYYWRIDQINTNGRVSKGAIWQFRPRHLAFPGAEGYGRFAIGGRGGRVVKVTSLADYRSDETPIPGTIRYAIEQETGPRTIVFDVSGLITLHSRLTLTQPNVTIAGQTAPGKGVTFRGWALGLSGARDAIVRYIRNRPGDIAGVTLDGGGLAGCDFSIMDHCSLSWALDEVFSSRGAKNITLQRTLISEALNIAGHQNYPAGTAHGYAATIGGDIGSFHHNLLAHNEGRNWSLGGGLDGSGNFAGRLDITNNVVYNWRGRTTDGGAMEVNFVNNYYKPGAATRHFYAFTLNHENNFGGSQRAYFAGNVMPGHFDETNQEDGRRRVINSGITVPYQTFVDTPFFPSHVETQTARDAYKRVLSDVGANAVIDDQDTRVIGETVAGTFTYTGTGPFGGHPGLPNSQNDVGGWEDYPAITRPAGWDSDHDGMPDWWEELNGFNKNSTPGDFSEANADADNDGYTNLEEYLNWLATPRAEVAPNATLQVDLSKLTRGYTNAPVHVVSSAQNGTVTLGADGKTASFTPSGDFVGLASFAYSVTDADSSSMSGIVNIRVTSAEPVPAITAHPLSQTASAGASVSLSVTATNAASYQWNKNGVALTGATTATLTITGAQASDSGNYTVDVINTSGTVTSNVATLEVNAVVVAPTITTHPVDQIIKVGETASFSVDATGTAPFTYQWKKGAAAITGATNATLTISDAQTSDSGSYTVEISNSAGTVTSNPANLTVNAPPPPPVITTQPTAQSVNVGDSVTLSVVATGSNLTYQWKKNGSVIDGATSASLTLTNVQPGDASAYTVDITGDGGTVTSDAAVLTVNLVAPAITTQPSAQSVAIGASATFSVTASGTAPLTYQWQKNGTDIAGANEATFTIAAAQIADLGQYRVVVTNAANSITSDAVALTLTPPAFAAFTRSGFAASATGGGNATPVLVTTAADFKTHAESGSAAVIVVAGILDLNTLSPAGVSVKSNKTIQGLNADATLSGPVTLGAGVTNVIFRGLNFTHPAGTPLTLSGATLVHVQNSTFFDGGDHLAKVVAGADNITFAWCEFYFSAASLASRNGVLVGNTSGETKAIRVSFAHNWWSDFVDQRMPSITYGHVHQFGNYFKTAATPNTAGVNALANAQLLSERNAFSGIVAPIAKSGGGLVRVIDNAYTSTSTSPVDTDAVFVPSYSYVVLKNDTLATALPAQAGNTAGAASEIPTSLATTASINGPTAAVANGAAFTLNAVSTLSSTLTYQWRLNNAPIAGATSAAYTVNNAQTSHSGTYTVAITPSNGNTLVSTPLTVTVNAPVPTNPNPPPSGGGGGGGGGSHSLGFFAALGLLALLRRMRRTE